MSFGRWEEQAPAGPHPGGDVGGDIQVNDSFCRRWARPLPAGRPGWMVITVYEFAAQENGQRWIETQIVHETTTDLDEMGWASEEVDVHYSSSYLDGPAAEAWPTDDDVKADLAGYEITIHDAWDGS